MAECVGYDIPEWVGKLLSQAGERPNRLRARTDERSDCEAVRSATHVAKGGARVKSAERRTRLVFALGFEKC